MSDFSAVVLTAVLFLVVVPFVGGFLSAMLEHLTGRDFALTSLAASNLVGSALVALLIMSAQDDRTRFAMYVVMVGGTCASFIGLLRGPVGAMATLSLVLLATLALIAVA